MASGRAEIELIFKRVPLMLALMRRTGWPASYRYWWIAAYDPEKRAVPDLDRRLSAGDVIVEISQEAVKTAADVQKRIDELKKDGRKLALLLVANPEGELRFVTLNLQ